MFNCNIKYNDTNVNIEFPCTNLTLFAKLADLHVPDDEKSKMDIYIEEVSYEPLKCLEGKLHDPDAVNLLATVRYHFKMKDGSEWYGTAEDHTNDGSKLIDFVSNAGTVVEGYVGYIDKSNGRIGTININSYKTSFKNKFEDAANEMPKSDKTMSSEDAANKANSAKSDSEEAKPEYKTISGGDAALLPSKCSSEQSEIDIPNVNKDSASSTLSGANSNTNSIMSKFLETGRNDTLVYHYSITIEG